MVKVVETAAQNQNIAMQMRLHPVWLQYDCSQTGCGTSKTLFYQAGNLCTSIIPTTHDKETFLLTDD